MTLLARPWSTGPEQPARGTVVTWRALAQLPILVVGIVAEWRDDSEDCAHLKRVSAFRAGTVDLLDGQRREDGGPRFDFVNRILRASPVGISPGIELVITLDPGRYADSIAFIVEDPRALPPQPTPPRLHQARCPSCGSPLRIVPGGENFFA